jgi:rifampin ADP-ribosylating transferase
MPFAPTAGRRRAGDKKGRRTAPPTTNLYRGQGLAARLRVVPRIVALPIGQDTRAGRTMREDEFAPDNDWVPVFPGNCDRVGGPFYHGTKAELTTGDLLTAGFTSNYDDRVVMNHIYFTALPKGAGLAAEMARGPGRPRVYVVEPTGGFEDDPNVTNKKFPGNPTRSYRSRHPLKIIGEIESWELFDPDFVAQLRSRIEAGLGEIIN